MVCLLCLCLCLFVLLVGLWFNIEVGECLGFVWVFLSFCRVMYMVLFMGVLVFLIMFEIVKGWLLWLLNDMLFRLWEIIILFFILYFNDLVMFVLIMVDNGCVNVEFVVILSDCILLYLKWLKKLLVVFIILKFLWVLFKDSGISYDICLLDWSVVIFLYLIFLVGVFILNIDDRSKLSCLFGVLIIRLILEMVCVKLVLIWVWIMFMYKSKLMLMVMFKSVRIVVVFLCFKFLIVMVFSIMYVFVFLGF